MNQVSGGLWSVRNPGQRNFCCMTAEKGHLQLNGYDRLHSADCITSSIGPFVLLLNEIDETLDLDQGARSASGASFPGILQVLHSLL